MQPLGENHLEVMRGLIYLRVFTQCVNKKSSTEQRNCFQAEQTDLFHVNDKDLIQSGRILIRLVSLSLVSFYYMLVGTSWAYVLYETYILLYIFARCHTACIIPHIISFSLQFVDFVFEREIQ